MLDIQELEPRSAETCVVRYLERREFNRLKKINEALLEQNSKVLRVVDHWVDELESETSAAASLKESEQV